MSGNRLRVLIVLLVGKATLLPGPVFGDAEVLAEDKISRFHDDRPPTSYTI